MPTGYTAHIEKGTVKTPKDFLRICLRNFGICLPIRDNDDIPLSETDLLPYIKEEIQKEIDFYEERLKNSIAELNRFDKLSEEDLYEKWRDDLNTKREPPSGNGNPPMTSRTSRSSPSTRSKSPRMTTLTTGSRRPTRWRNPLGRTSSRSQMKSGRSTGTIFWRRSTTTGKPSKRRGRAWNLPSASTPASRTTSRTSAISPQP